MSFQMELDRIAVNGTVRPLTMPIHAEAGDAVEIGGWAIDGDTRRGVAQLVARIVVVVYGSGGASVPMPEGDFAFIARTRIARPELASKLGMDSVECGFVVSIPTDRLPPSMHGIRFVITSDTGTEWTSSELPLQLSARRHIARRQIVLATAMKSGGRHVQSVLQSYFGITNPPFGEGNDGEHLMTSAYLGPARDKPFVMCSHFTGRAVNLNAIAEGGFAAVLTWRNLGDVVVSLDDHTRLAPEIVWRNTYTFLPSREEYNTMPDQKRYQFQIRNAIPWYFNYYLSWRWGRIPLIMRYEWMATDPFAYFRYLIVQLDGGCDDQRLREIVAGGPTQASGFNVGRVGRSTTALSEESKRMLEDCIREHPFDLRELLYELPWYAATYGAPKLIATGPHDVFLVAEGSKRRANDHWLRTHGFERSSIPVVSAADADTYTTGSDLY